MPSIDLAEAKTLRTQVRRKRRQLSYFELKQAEQNTLYQLQKLSQMKSAHRVGVYLDAFGEVPTTKIIMLLFKLKKEVYLPLICNMNQKLRWQKISFHQWRSRRFALHRLGMLQAMHAHGQNVAKLDLLLMPLVLFDEAGHRVGMGGGFYDRTLANCPYKPYRVGLAHDFQQTSLILNVQKWDQSLDAICTPTKTLIFRR